jgi:hypothetical protein
MLPTQFKITIVTLALLLGGIGVQGQETYSMLANISEEIIAGNDLVLLPLNNSSEECACISKGYPKEPLSFNERDAILFMREEEKLARDIYLRLYEMWGAQPFENMRQVEERHMAALLCLISKYELKDPVGDRAVGSFKTHEFAKLYKILLKKGSQSLPDSYAVGAMLEVWDMSDKIEIEEDLDNKDLIAVVEELRRSSRNHMRSLDLNLLEHGMTFHPVSIAPTVYKNVTASDTEREGKICGNMNLCIKSGAELPENRPCKVVANQKKNY